VNFLAHLLLSPPTADGRLGGLLGDFVKGPLTHAGYPPSVVDGIRLHRQVDTFTDAHPAVQAARNLVSPGRRRFAGILVDVFFDHFLARRWEHWHPAPLRRFADLVYDELARTPHPVPPRFAAMAPTMAAQDWLGTYANIAGIALTLERMSRRSSVAAPLAGGAEELCRAFEGFERAFEAFFPQVLEQVADLGRRGAGSAPQSVVPAQTPIA
jgi:acyl carrier protein phosphodiesterase